MMQPFVLPLEGIAAQLANDSIEGSAVAVQNHTPSGITAAGKKWAVYTGDARGILRTLPAGAYNCVITSPPYYWLRDYDMEGQMGQEDTVTLYVEAIASVMDEVFRVLRKDGLLFLNMGDTYYSGKGQPTQPDRKSRKRRFGLRGVDASGGVGIGVRPKTAIGIPWRVAIEMCRRRWVLRSDIIWNRVHALPEHVLDRPRRSYEHVFMFSKDRKYYFNRPVLVATGEEDIWTIEARPAQVDGIDTAPFPDKLVQRCLDIGCPAGGSVLDPFAGSGTTLRVSLKLGHNVTGIDLNPKFSSYMIDMLSSL